MPYTIRNARPSVLHIPDAGVRLEAGQTTVVTAITPQMGSLLTARVLEVVANDVPASVPVVTSPVSDEPALEASNVPDGNRPEAKRGGRRASASPVTLEPRDDAQ